MKSRAMRSRSISAIVMLFFSCFGCSSALSEDERGWICVGEFATGFSYVEGSGWRASGFKPETYIVKKPDVNDIKGVRGDVYWVVKKLDDNTARHFCQEDGKLYLYCEGIYGTFAINKENRRFQHVYPIGYLQDWRRDNPLILIGKCTNF